MAIIKCVTMSVPDVSKMLTAKCIVVVIALSSFTGATESIFGQCTNEGDTYNCSGTGLTDVPGGEHIPTYVNTIDLSNNHIHNISLLDYPELSDSLKTLDLSRNQISLLKRDAFQYLKALVSLDLSNNLLIGDSLKEDMFFDLRELRHLNMERNPLRRLKSSTLTFMELPSLEHLDISHCEIDELEPGSLDLTSLIYIDLSWNKLQSFNRDSFRMFVNLQTLDMSHNRITVLNNVPYMPALVTWILDSNGMTTVEIGNGLVDYADNIQSLLLRNNDVAHFKAESFDLDELEHLQVIDMTNNKLNCDCKMRWIRANNYNFKGKNYSFICDKPSNLRNMNILDVAPEDLKCGLSLNKILFIVMLSTVSAIIIAIVIFFVIRRRQRRRLEKKAARGDMGGNYTAVFSRDDDDVKVSMADNKRLLEDDPGREFDV